MGLSLKYVVLTNAGTWHYRRRVPKAARTTFPQSEFKRLLGDTRREALRNWPHVHAEFERLTSNHAAQQLPPPKTSDQLCSMDASTNSHSEVIASTPPLEAAKNSHHKAKALKPTLADAKQLYLQERIIGDINERHKTARIERVMAHLHAVITPDCLLSDLTRSQAREVRDRMLTELQMTPITVKRYPVVKYAPVSTIIGTNDDSELRIKPARARLPNSSLCASLRSLSGSPMSCK